MIELACFAILAYLVFAHIIKRHEANIKTAVAEALWEAEEQRKERMYAAEAEQERRDEALQQAEADAWADTSTPEKLRKATALCHEMHRRGLRSTWIITE